jgi:hypothetical protein
MSLSDLIKYIKSKTYHNCSKYELYYEDYNERGTYCDFCNKTISHEVFYSSDLPPSQDLGSTYHRGA